MKKYIQSSTISGNVGIWWITDKNDVIGIMKPVEDVIRILNITRPTLTHWIQSGYIKTTTLPNGRYDNDEDID